MDNSEKKKKSYQRFQQNHTIRVSHPLYCLGLGPSDYYLLGTSKKGFHINYFLYELIDAIIEILNNIPHENIEKIFSGWIER